jgi:microcystin-dependent protein
MGGVAAGRITNAGSGIVGTTLGAVGGLETNTLTTAQMPTHSHVLTDPGHTHDVKFTNITNGGLGGSGGFTTSISSGGTSTGAAAAISNTTGITMATTGSGTAHANVQPTLIVNKIIYTGV